jgi:hypothetical protein
MALDLSDEEKVALVGLLTRTVANDQRPASPRVRILKSVLVKLDAKPLARPYPTATVHAPPGPKRTDIRRE